MKIKLAGYNVDATQLEGLPGSLTPETLVAAYARISRDPSDISTLRQQAIEDVAKARKTNNSVIFDMGHCSVSECAVLNFDMEGISRLAIEAIEHSRLCSYTEKSQRFCKLENDFVIPVELEGEVRSLFIEMVKDQFKTYNTIFIRLLTHYSKQLDKKTAEGRAKEDARYVTCLAVEGQLGMTLNARSLETMIRRLISHPLLEVKDIGRALFREAKAVIPSLLRYCDPIKSLVEIPKRLGKEAKIIGRNYSTSGICKLIDYTPDGDYKVLTALIHGAAFTTYADCETYVEGLGKIRRIHLMEDLLINLKVWEALPRALEIVSFTFELLVSASCFAQLKRHRLMTVLPQSYSPFLGVTYPPSFFEAGIDVKNIFYDTLEIYERINKNHPDVAPYILTQAHRRRVLVTVNARELYHFSRLREDKHAQWEIKELAITMLNSVKEKCPITFMLACGKDQFEKVRNEIFCE